LQSHNCILLIIKEVYKCYRIRAFKECMRALPCVFWIFVSYLFSSTFFFSLTRVFFFHITRARISACVGTLRTYVRSHTQFEIAVTVLKNYALWLDNTHCPAALSPCSPLKKIFKAPFFSYTLLFNTTLFQHTTSHCIFYTQLLNIKGKVI
jgi:hypothetical protein